MESMPPWSIFSCYFFFPVPFSFNKIIFLSFWNIDLWYIIWLDCSTSLCIILQKKIWKMCVTLKNLLIRKNYLKKNLVLLSVHACRSKLSTQCYKRTNVSLVGDPSCPADKPHCLWVLPSHEVASLHKGWLDASQGIYIWCTRVDHLLIFSSENICNVALMDGFDSTQVQCMVL